MPSIKSILKKIILSTLVVMILALFVTTIFVWQLAHDIAQPKRRPLQDYHHYWLNHAQEEGIKITSYPCASGQAPCLFITPTIVSEMKKWDKENERKCINNTSSEFDTVPQIQFAHYTSALGTRGQIIRQQLQQDFHHILPEQTLPHTDGVWHPKGIMVLLHGRRGRKEDLLPVATRFSAVGFVTIVLDLPAHGESPLQYSAFGTELVHTSTQQDIINQSLADVRAWLHTQQASNTPNEFEINHDDADLPAFLWAMSMGGSYAIHALGEHQCEKQCQHEDNQNNWDGLIIVSSFARMSELAQDQVEQMTSGLSKPIQSVLQPVLLKMFAVFVEWQGGAKPDQVNPADIARGLSIPVLMLHGDQDKVIDISQGQSLYQAYASDVDGSVDGHYSNHSKNDGAQSHHFSSNKINDLKNDKTWITVAGAGHNNVLVTDAPVYATMTDWLLRHSIIQCGKH